MPSHPDQLSLELFSDERKSSDGVGWFAPPVTSSLASSVGETPYQFVVDRLSEELALPKPEALPPGSVCALTGFPIRFGYRQENYRIQQTISPLAACFSLQAIERLGVERMASATPVGYALCKIAGAKVLVPRNKRQPVEIWTGGQYLERLRGDFFRIQNFTGHAAYRALLDLEFDGAVFEMSLRIERVLKHFRVTTPQNLVVLRDSGALVLPRKHWTSFRSDFSEMGNKHRRDFTALARGLLNGKHSLLDEEVQNKLRLEPFYMDLLRLLPASPQAALVYLQAAAV